MQSGTVTTPFGRRPMTLALVRGQVDAAEIPTGKSADKWKIFRDVAEARSVLGLHDRTLAVLNALLSFYPESELAEARGLVVFPSNAQLSIRAHGIAGTTLRRHLAALVEAGLIHRRDSPNGKRYAHRGRTGDVEQAFGFSLAPLLARAEEFAGLAQAVAEERLQFKRTKEALTICRRDVRKLLSAAIEEGAPGDWGAMEARFVALVGRLPRSPGRMEIAAILEEMEALRQDIVNQLENKSNSQNTAASDGQGGRHIQNSKPESIHELEPRLETKQGAPAIPIANAVKPAVGAFPLGMVLRACPEIAMYGADGRISDWRSLMAAAVVVRSMLGVSPSAYQEACEAMGPENAAVAVACILERAGHIASPGGYLRDLTRKAARGEFSLGPMLMALLRANGGAARGTG